MDGPLKDRITTELENAARIETENLVLTPKTLDEYLRVVGKVQGLRLAIQIIDETYSDFMRS